MLNFWGKARSGGSSGEARFHPAAYHMLDVAACARLLLDDLTRDLRGPLRHLCVFLIGLHDIGKFSCTFQALSPEHWPTAALGPFQRPPPDARHDTLGFRILSERFMEALLRKLPAWTDLHLDPLLRAVTGHHGRPPTEEGGSRLSTKTFSPACRAAAAEMIDALWALLMSEPPPPPPDEATTRRLSWMLAGLATLADWIGSARMHFPYTEPMKGDLPAYWPIALERAGRAIQAASVLPARSAPETDLAGLFPIIQSASPVQHWAETTALPDGPVLALIEDVTGSGKTEAAVVLAHRLIAAGRAAGLFFALPTMATADAMFARLGASYRRLYAADARPSLVLAHGRRHLHTGFRDAVLRGLHPEATEIGEHPAGAECAAWIAEDRRLAFLADIGAGTIDQAFLGVLPTRHATLRLLGLSRRVLIIDEAHAYDTYMRQELKALLRFQAALGGSAIVLSATLPHAVRSGLFGAFAEGLGATAPLLTATHYPLTTLVSVSSATEAKQGTRPDRNRSVGVQRLPTLEAAVDVIEAAAKSGAATVWVRNTVDEAIETTKLLRERGLSPMLFHARYAMGDRQRIQAEVMAIFGDQDEEAVLRRRGKVLVATQVVEQSLDLDFDVMVSDLAPVDLLVQRAGRLWRHERGPRPVDQPVLYVVSNEPVAEPPAYWVRNLLPGTAAVYPDPALLWRGARALFAAGVIETPGEGIAHAGSVRALIEGSYDPDGEIPAAFEKAVNRTEGKDLSAGAQADLNVLRPEAGYASGYGAWASDIRTPTRLGEETITLRLAKWQATAIAPWCAELESDPLRAWALSEVAVRRNRATGTPIPPDATAALERALANWPDWDREIPVLVLSQSADGWARGTILDGTGKPQPVLYSAKGAGLVFSPDCH